MKEPLVFLLGIPTLAAPLWILVNSVFFGG